MNSFFSKPLSRRHVLQGLGVSLSLPLLDAMLPSVYARPSTYQPLSKSMGVHPRMICCYIPNGVNIMEWVPKTSGKNYSLSPTLQTLQKHRQDFTVISGIGHPTSKGGHSGADTWLTGADLQAVPGSDYSNSISADQVAAELHGQQTRYPSLQLSDQSGTGAAGHSHSLSFNRTGIPIPALNSPRQLFDRLFSAESTQDKKAALKRYAEKKSILDSVLKDAKSLHKKLGTADQKKLDQYLTSVRETEKQVERLESWIDVPKKEVDSRGLQLESQPRNSHDRPMWIDVMLEISYLAFLTDTTRIISFEWSREAGGFGGGGENHHALSHHGGDTGMLKQLATIDRFHLQKLSRFLDFLQATQDGDGNMLDNTMIMLGSGMNSGEGGAHSPKNLPLLVAGGHQLGLKHGQHLKFDTDNHPPLSNLLLTLIQKMGVQAESFRDSTGTLNGLV